MKSSIIPLPFYLQHLNSILSTVIMLLTFVILYFVFRAAKSSQNVTTVSPESSIVPSPIPETTINPELILLPPRGPLINTKMGSTEVLTSIPVTPLSTVLSGTVPIIQPSVGLATPPMSLETNGRGNSISDVGKNTLVPISSKLPELKMNTPFPTEFLETQFPKNTKTLEEIRKERALDLKRDTSKDDNPILVYKEPAAFTPYSLDYVLQI